MSVCVCVCVFSENIPWFTIPKWHLLIVWQPWKACCCCCCVAPVMSDSVWPNRRQPTKLPCPWDSPGKNTVVGCHFLLQCMKVKSESEVVLRDPMDCSLPGSSVPGIFQARVLEYSFVLHCTAIAFSQENINICNSKHWAQPALSNKEPKIVIHTPLMYCWWCVHIALKEQDEIFAKEKDLSFETLWDESIGN